MEILDVLVIGAGPAGLTAGMYAARRSMSAQILESKAAGGQMAAAKLVENYPGFPEGIEGTALSEKMLEQTKKHGVSILEESAVSIERENGLFSTKCASNKKYLSRTVIIATGAAFRKLPIKNQDQFIGKGMSYCTLCDGRLFKGKTVAVVGGGSAALSAALYLEKVAKKVYLVHRREELRAEESLINQFKSSKVEPIWFKIIDAVDGKDTLEKMTIKDTKTGELADIAVEGLFIEIGAVPSTELVRGTGVEISERGYILANPRQETNIPGIYAAGDVTGRLAQITTAVGDATVASISAYEYIRQQKQAQK